MYLCLCPKFVCMRFFFSVMQLHALGIPTCSCVQRQNMQKSNEDYAEQSSPRAVLDSRVLRPSGLFGRRVGFRFFGRRGVRASGFQRRSIDFEEESVLRDYTTHLERRPVECVKGVSKSTYKVVSNRLWRLCRGARGVWVRHVLTARSLGALLPSCCVCVIAHADER